MTGLYLNRDAWIAVAFLALVIVLAVIRWRGSS